MRLLVWIGVPLVLTAVAALYVAATRPGIERSAASADSIQPTREPSAAPHEPLSDVLSSPQRDERSLQRAAIPAPPPPPEPEGLEETLSAPQPAGDFSHKYAGVDRAARVVALAGVQEELSARLDELANVAFEEGRFEVADAPLGTEDDKKQLVFDVEGVLFRARPCGDDSAPARPTIESRAKVELVWFPARDFPELYELDSERRWLDNSLSSGERR